MVKLKMLSRYKIEDTPDHIIEQINNSCMKLVVHMGPLIHQMAPNIALNAMQFANAIIIKNLVSDDPEELRKAAKWCAAELLKNVEALIKNAQQDEEV